jgi:cellulose biosynthesis protein BcsQ
MTATFDEALPRLFDLLRAEFGEEWLNDALIIRDTNGRLAVLTKRSIEAESSQRIFHTAMERLPDYIDTDLGLFASPSDLDEDSSPSQSRPMVISTDHGPAVVQIIDRRIIGQDWSALPAPGWRRPQPARIVFWSLKGGVGRTTALAVAAADLARRGKRVLAIDLDLEAPGLGSILLEQDSLPEFGTLDWYVEYGRSTQNERLVDGLAAPSSLSDYSGILHVAPAIGARAKRAPENVIAKLGRAYLESITADGSVESFSVHTQNLINELQSRNSYDAIMIDARAGLNETTAAALLGIGADVLMFAENTPQSFDGYRFLLAHLRGLPASPEDDWRLRLKMVHAKAQPNSSRLFNDRAFQLFSEFLYEEEGTDEAFNFDIDDPDAPHVPWVIADDSNYRHFDPLAARDQLSERVYEATFGNLLVGIANRIAVDTEVAE